MGTDVIDLRNGTVKHSEPSFLELFVGYKVLQGWRATKQLAASTSVFMGGAAGAFAAAGWYPLLIPAVATMAYGVKYFYKASVAERKILNAKNLDEVMARIF